MHRQASIRASRAIKPTLLLATTKTIATRHLSNSNERVRNYLDAWIGSKPSSSKSLSKTSTLETKNSTKNTTKLPPLLLSGSSYLIPTLRIERNNTPESISARIAAALQQDDIPNTGIVKTMLQGKVSSSGRWKAPIILDLHALIPDGSPHYEPPPVGLLAGLVQVLDNYGIQVVGVTNTPPILEQEAIEKLGLPAFRSKGRVLDRQSATSKVNVEQVIKMLLVKSQEHCVHLENEQGEEAVDMDVSSAELVDDTISEATTTLEMNDAERNKADSDTAVVNGSTATTVMEEGILESTDESQHTDTDDAESTVVPTPEGGTHVYHGNVRSGQQVVAQQNQSLVIIGSVNSGGEVMSDRDIFVFGKLRGRALAGLATTASTGNARIFATSFDPELICIGDTFTTVDTVSELGLNKPGEAAMVTLDSSSRELVFERIPL